MYENCDPNIRWKMFICATGRKSENRGAVGTGSFLWRKLISL